MSRAHISADDERRRIVLACRTMPRSDLSLTPIGKLNKALTQPRYGFV
jgi:hypothetical protein